MYNTFIAPTINQQYSYRNEIIATLEAMFSFYTNQHSKCLVIRFDVHYPSGYPYAYSNTDISNCIAYVIKQYKRQGLDPYYMWVREQHKSSFPHYHCLLLLDGQKVMSYRHVFTIVERAWSNALGGYPVSGCVHHCVDPSNVDANGKMIRRDMSPENYAIRCQEVFDQVSYLAKSYTKATDNDGMRNFGSSRFPKNIIN